MSRESGPSLDVGFRPLRAGVRIGCLVPAVAVALLGGCTARVVEFQADGRTPAREARVPWPQTYKCEAFVIEPGAGTVEAAKDATTRAIEVVGPKALEIGADAAAKAAATQGSRQ